MGWVPEKPKVLRWGEGQWVVELEHQTWTEQTWFGTWETAMGHALWLGLANGVWSLE